MPAKHTRNVVLTDHHQAFVEDLVTSGRYQNASEVMREGLRALEERVAREDANLAELQKRIAHSLDQLDRGEYVEGTSEEILRGAFEEAKRRLDM